jgi:hypothetical protein
LFDLLIGVLLINWILLGFFIRAGIVLIGVVMSGVWKRTVRRVFDIFNDFSDFF